MSNVIFYQGIWPSEKQRTGSTSEKKKNYTATPEKRRTLDGPYSCYFRLLSLNIWNSNGRPWVQCSHLCNSNRLSVFEIHRKIAKLYLEPSRRKLRKTQKNTQPKGKGFRTQRGDLNFAKNAREVSISSFQNEATPTLGERIAPEPLPPRRRKRPNFRLGLEPGSLG